MSSMQVIPIPVAVALIVFTTMNTINSFVYSFESIRKKFDVKKKTKYPAYRPLDLFAKDVY